MHWKDVNRYGYSPTGLFIPYALVCLFTSIIVIIGAFTFKHDGVHPDKKFQNILCASGDPEAIQLAYDRDPTTSRRQSLAAEHGGRHPTFRVEDRR